MRTVCVHEAKRTRSTLDLYPGDLCLRSSQLPYVLYISCSHLEEHSALRGECDLELPSLDLIDRGQVTEVQQAPLRDQYAVPTSGCPVRNPTACCSEHVGWLHEHSELMGIKTDLAPTDILARKIRGQMHRALAICMYI